MSARWALEHALWRRLKADGMVGVPAVISVSGGADSLALAAAWSAVRPKDEVLWLHIHHGSGATSTFRDEAEALVRSQAAALGVRCQVERVSPVHETEDAWRQARREVWQQVLEQLGREAWLVTAHHAEDLLETRLLQLIRGAGVRGLTGFQRCRGRLYRPFLDVDPQELRVYLRQRGIDWIEDPGNKDPRHLRNWLRHRWLPALEERKAGGVASLARSLENLSEALRGQEGPLAGSPPILTHEYLGLGGRERRRWIMEKFASLGATSVSRSQIEEVQRRLDSSRKDHSFIVADVHWSVNAQQILAVRRSAFRQL